MSSSSLRVAVVGAGASGLAAIKCCLDEGITPVCFERTDRIGGLWHYTDERVDNQACVMKSTVINTSKELMSYSDFPMPAHFPNYMHNSQVLEYLLQYIARFDLDRHIRYKTEVMKIKKATDFSTTGRWEIRHRDITTGDESTEIFDGVLVASGYNASTLVPEFPGLQEFQGKISHSNDYRVPTGYEDKNVVVVGIGNSAGDVAVELSRVAKQVYISTRRGTWVLSRVSDRGYPFDILSRTRFVEWLHKTFHGITEKLEERKMNSRFDHTLYRLKPAHSAWAYQPIVNDDLPNRIISGAVKVKDNIKRFTQHGIEFVDGTYEENIDAVIFATGYNIGFSFLDKEVVEVKNNSLRLYKLTYPPDLEKHTLAMIGCFQQLGALMPISEMQCRLATRVIKGLIDLPSREAMWRDIRERENMVAKKFVESQRYSILVDFASFMDELSQLVGCCPNPAALVLSDPKLAYHVMFGPVYPYTYRLFGPGQWKGAREAILTAWDRVEAPFKTRPLTEAASGSGFKPGQLQPYLFWALMILFACLAFLLL